MLAVGNPLAPSGTFYAVSPPGSGWEALRIAASDIPNVEEGRVVVPGLLTREGIERIRGMYGEGSPIYTARVEGEFPDVGDAGLCRRSWLEAAAERWRDWSGRNGGEPREPATVAVDPARFGPDLTVVAIARGDVVAEITTLGGRLDLMESASRVLELLEDADPVSRVVVDEVGLGAGLADRLRELGYRGLEGFNGGRAARDTERFLNLRAASYWNLRDRLERGEVALPPDEMLFDELLALRWRPTPDGKVQLESKEELKGRIGRSPDRADADDGALPAVGEEVPPGRMDRPMRGGLPAERGRDSREKKEEAMRRGRGGRDISSVRGRSLDTWTTWMPPRGRLKTTAGLATREEVIARLDEVGPLKRRDLRKLGDAGLAGLAVGLGVARVADDDSEGYLARAARMRGNGIVAYVTE